MSKANQKPRQEQNGEKFGKRNISGGNSWERLRDYARVGARD